jgi:hypothetical protein
LCSTALRCRGGAIRFVNGRDLNRDAAVAAHGVVARNEVAKQPLEVGDRAGKWLAATAFGLADEGPLARHDG